MSAIKQASAFALVPALLGESGARDTMRTELEARKDAQLTDVDNGVGFVHSDFTAY